MALAFLELSDVLTTVEIGHSSLTIRHRVKHFTFVVFSAFERECGILSAGMAGWENDEQGEGAEYSECLVCGGHWECLRVDYEDSMDNYNSKGGGKMVLWRDWEMEGWAMRGVCGVLSVVVLLGGVGASGELSEEAKPLKGLTGIKVLTEELNDAAKEMGFSDKELKMEIELLLRMAGIHDVGLDEGTDNYTEGLLYDRIHVVGVTSGDGVRRGYVYNIWLGCYQMAVLETDDQGLRRLVLTWHESFTGLGIGPNVADIAKEVLAKSRAPERCNVYEIMSKPVLSVKPEMHIRYCARMFHNFGISAAPVISCEGDIKGIVAYDELVLKGLAEYTY